MSRDVLVNNENVRGEGSLPEQQGRLRMVACWYFGEDGPFAPQFDVHGVEDYPSEVGYVLSRATYNLTAGFSEQEVASVNSDMPEPYMLEIFRYKVRSRRAGQLDDAALYLSNVAKGFEHLPKGVEIEGVNKK